MVMIDFKKVTTVASVAALTVGLSACNGGVKVLPEGRITFDHNLEDTTYLTTDPQGNLLYRAAESINGDFRCNAERPGVSYLHHRTDGTIDLRNQDQTLGDTYAYCPNVELSEHARTHVVGGDMDNKIWISTVNNDNLDDEYDVYFSGGNGFDTAQFSLPVNFETELNFSVAAATNSEEIAVNVMRAQYTDASNGKITIIDLGLDVEEMCDVGYNCKSTQQISDEIGLGLTFGD